MSKELDHIQFPEGSMNTIIHHTDGTRAVFASPEIRFLIGNAIDNNMDIEFEYDEPAKTIRVHETIYSCSVRELEKGSWLFFSVAKIEEK